MTVSVNGDAFWPMIADLGAAIALPAAEPPYAALLTLLADRCGAVAELWRTAAATPETGWQLLAHSASVGLTVSAPKSPAAVAGSAAAALRPVAVAQPFPQVALPLLVRGRLQGILYLHAADGRLLAWQEALAGLAPLLALSLHADLPAVPAEETMAQRVASLASSAHLSEQLERELARARRTFRPCALLMTGVDRFDEFVARVGASTWEQIAQSLTITLRDVCRDGDMVGRYGLDRHLIFLSESDGAGAALAARRYLSQLYRRPIIIPDHEPFYLDASIGIALFPVDGATVSELLASASTALATAQHLGGRRAVAA
jgi:diguanylate cyclase (GGDEF)-like protein